MAIKIPKISPITEAAKLKQIAINELVLKFGRWMAHRITLAIEAGQIDDWTNPSNETSLNSKLIAIAGKTDKTQKDLINIACIAAILFNFEDPDVEQDDLHEL